MWVESEMGSGQHVPLHRREVPRCDEAPLTAPAAWSHRADDAWAPRVLVVDDNATNRRLDSGRDGEQFRGMKPVAAVPGAAELMEELRPRSAREARSTDFHHLVLTDVNMPDVDGIRRLPADSIRGRRRISRRASSIIMLTSGDQSGATANARCQELGRRRTPDEAGQAVGTLRRHRTGAGGIQSAAESTRIPGAPLRSMRNGGSRTAADSARRRLILGQPAARHRLSSRNKATRCHRGGEQRSKGDRTVAGRSRSIWC